jgi:predicted DCC family thiol-disulfide oxidoreductase YuxK
MQDITKTLKEHAIIIFDGQCNLCDNSVNFIINRDPNCFFKFTPQQSPFAQKILKETYGNKIPDSVILINQKGIYNRSSALLRIASKLPGGWKIFTLLRVIPPFLLNPFYRSLAIVRKKVFGSREVCLIPTPERLTHFLATE